MLGVGPGAAATRGRTRTASLLLPREPGRAASERVSGRLEAAAAVVLQLAVGGFGLLGAPVQRPKAPRGGPTAWLGLLLAGCSSNAPQVETEESAPRPRIGAVVAEQPLAVAAGLEVLSAGGNAVDAAVATALALAVVYPQAGNLGGGGFALVVLEADPKRVHCLDFREIAPAALAEKDFVDTQGRLVPGRSLDSHLAVAVPGSPAGLEALQARFGRLPLRSVVQPALRLAREGFPVDAFLARDLARPELAARLERNAAARSLFFPGGAALAVGQQLKQPELARTLERFAEGGAQAFYTGPVAEALAAEMRRGRGKLGLADLAGYRPTWRDPLEGRFRGRRIFTVPPPSSGGLLLLQALEILEGLPLEAERRANLGVDGAEEGAAAGLTPRVLHWWIEILRRGFADRAQHLGDPEFHRVPARELLDPSWIAARRTSIGERAQPGVGPWAPPDPEGDETTHLCVVDGEGNAVSLTTSLNTSFGSGILVPGAGFLLNNHIDDFSLGDGAANTYGLVGSRANRLEAGKRPLSSMAPTLVLREDGGLELVLGSPGGPRIVSALFQVLARHLVHGEALEFAVRAPRLHQQWNPISTLVEPGWPTELLQALIDRGHELVRSDETFASVQAIQVLPGGGVIAVSDPRRGGVGGLTDRPLPAPASPGARGNFY